MKRLKLGLLVSGNGSNLQAIIDASEKGEIDASVSVVISNRQKAYALERAKKHHIPSFVVPQGALQEKEILKILEQYSVDLVCLAGFLKILSKDFVKKFLDRIINIHPALLPSFPGLHAIEQALKAGVKKTGVTLHFVDEGVDTGPILLQEEVLILKDDTVETLTARIHQVEHRIYPQAIQLIATERLKIEEGRVWIKQGG